MRQLANQKPAIAVTNHQLRSLIRSQDAPSRSELNHTPLPEQRTLPRIDTLAGCEGKHDARESRQRGWRVGDNAMSQARAVKYIDATATDDITKAGRQTVGKIRVVDKRWCLLFVINHRLTKKRRTKQVLDLDNQNSIEDGMVVERCLARAIPVVSI